MELKFDLREFERAGRAVGATAKQLPFALSVALNEGARETKDAEETALSSSFDRPTPFTKRAIGQTYANKRDLHVEVFVKDIQAKYLSYGVEGGTRTGKGNLPVPGKSMRLNQYGNMPKGAVGKAAAKTNTFVGRPNGRADPAQDLCRTICWHGRGFSAPAVRAKSRDHQ